MHLIRSVPDLHLRNPAAAETRALLARHSVIVHAEHLPSGRALQPECLMITTVFGGAVCVRMGESRVVLRDGFYFVANANEPREFEPCSASGGEVLSVLPHKDFVLGIMAGERAPGHAGPGGFRPAQRHPKFFESTQPHDQFVSPHLFALRHALQGGPLSLAFAENSLSQVVNGLFRRDQALADSAAKIPRVRSGTRAEIFCRLRRARELIDSSFGEIRTLADVATAASMSYAHFNRFFTICFGVTPHRCLTERRLDVARGDLRKNHLSITEIAYAVGFENVNSFTALFRRRFGLLPSQFRRGEPISEDRLAAPRGAQPRIARDDPSGRPTVT